MGLAVAVANAYDRAAVQPRLVQGHPHLMLGFRLAQPAGGEEAVERALAAVVHLDLLDALGGAAVSPAVGDWGHDAGSHVVGQLPVRPNLDQQGPSVGALAIP